MAEPVSFLIGRSGIVFLVRESGRRQKCGFRFHKGHIEVFDRQASQWHPLPESLVSQRGGVISVIVFSEDDEEEHA